MTCVTGTATFRLLDAYVGWDSASAQGLVGLDQPEGLMLALAQADGGLSAWEIARRFGSPRLARGCGPCEWYVATGTGRVLRRDRCALEFQPVWPDGCAFPIVRATAVAARRHAFAVADAGARRVWLFDGAGRARAEIALERPGPLAFTHTGGLLVAISGTTTLVRHSPTGDDLGSLRIRIAGEITHLVLAPDCSHWAVVRADDGRTVVFSAAPGGDSFVRATLEELRAALPELPIAALGADGFCLEDAHASGFPVRRCYDWEGEAIADVGAPVEPTRVAQGQLLTEAIDSGRPQCSWHRVRVDADVPRGTGVSVAVATSDVAIPPAQGDAAADPAWQDFDPGIPHPGDWQEAPAGSLDFLIDQPPGRYLFVRVRLTGHGASTPVVRRVRLDFPRATSFDHLPAIYHRAPEAEDFGERFVSLFDASIEELDSAIERHPALLDVDGVPDEVLPWLGAFLDLAAEPWWGADRHRRLLRAAPDLYRRRGTPRGLADAVEHVFGVRPALSEHAAGRAWAAVGTGARVRGVRLFARARSRMRVGRSELGRAPLRSIGNPDLDPLVADAYRFTVLVPAGAVRGSGQTRFPAAARRCSGTCAHGADRPGRRHRLRRRNLVGGRCRHGVHGAAGPGPRRRGRKRPSLASDRPLRRPERRRDGFHCRRRLEHGGPMTHVHYSREKQMYGNGNGNGNGNGGLATLPTFDRLRYFYGQLLGARDFQIEQAYFREKLKLQNRCLHGYGVVCGLEVYVGDPEDDCAPRTPDDRDDMEKKLGKLKKQLTNKLRDSSPDEYEKKSKEAAEMERRLSAPAALYVAPGLALDCEGNELIVRGPLRFDPWKLLKPSDRRKLDEGDEATIYVTLCYREQPIEPTRPAIADPCGDVAACTFGKLRDAVCVEVTLDEPRRDERCDTCCAGCQCECLLIARLSGLVEDRPVAADAIDNSVRRELARTTRTAITGVSWSHGGTYTPDSAREILGGDGSGDGLEMRFSQRIRAEDLRDPVLEITVAERGRGRAAGVYQVAGEFVNLPGSGFVDSFRYRQTSGETLQGGDLVFVTFRAPMVLDECCLPVVGLNVGGRVPLLEDYSDLRSGDPPAGCEQPPFKAGPWTTWGDGNFESWFFISTEGAAK